MRLSFRNSLHNASTVPGSATDSRKHSGLLLLAVFLIGGMAAPSLHRAQHAAELDRLARERRPDESCEHVDHRSCYKVDRIDLSDDQCTLCRREVQTVPAPPVPESAAELHHDWASKPVQTVRPSLLPLRPIRGPPFSV